MVAFIHVTYSRKLRSVAPPFSIMLYIVNYLSGCLLSLQSFVKAKSFFGKHIASLEYAKSSILDFRPSTRVFDVSNFRSSSASAWRRAVIVANGHDAATSQEVSTYLFA